MITELSTVFIANVLLVGCVGCGLYWIVKTLNGVI